MGALLASICWFLWKARNKALFEGQGCDCIKIVEKAYAICSEFKEAFAVPNRVSSGSSNSTPTPMWHGPPASVIKLNVDGAVDRRSGIVGVGFVARNHLGQILGTSSIPFPGLLSPRVAEALGFCEALVLAANNGLAEIIIEGDSIQIVQALNQAGKSYSDCSSILSDCLELLPLFSSCAFEYVNRSFNRVAHSLAKQSLLGARLDNWGGSCPPAFN